MEMEKNRWNIDDKPPLFIAIVTAFQHYLTMFVSSFSTPFFYVQAMCLDITQPDINDIVNTIFLVSGITTLLQSTIGVRLPIIQGTSLSFLLPILSILSQPQWQCPDKYGNLSYYNSNNSNDSRQANDDIWKTRMGEISGDIMCTAVLEIVIGATGVMSVILRYIGPITIAPVIATVGLSLFKVVADMCSLQWAVAMLVLVLITIMSQFLGTIWLPLPHCSSRCTKQERNCQGMNSSRPRRIPMFSIFSFLLPVLAVWLLCYILTISGVFGDNPGQAGYYARTDLRTDAFVNTKWFRIPYPFQFGWPTVSLSGVIGMFTAVFASIVESIGDYYACAKVSGAPRPPSHAINRGIVVEGFGCLMAGMFGTGIGSTSYSQNVALISITKVGCRLVIQMCSVMCIILALFGKFSALFVTIPVPIIGGLFMVTFSMIVSLGLSNLNATDLSSSRNQYIIGLSLFVALSVPEFIRSHPGYIKTGNAILDSILTVLLSNGIFVAGGIAFTLDNAVPGTPEERGLIEQPFKSEPVGEELVMKSSTYDIPYINRCLCSWAKYIPFCQTFEGYTYRKKGSLSVTENVEI